jgi:transposase InsO family protein
MTDNGSCHRSRAFAESLGDIDHRRTPCLPAPDHGKVEQFHRTLADGWAYARLYRSDAERSEEVTT